MDFLSGLTKPSESKPAEEAKPVEKAPGPDMLTTIKGKAAGAGADAVSAVSGFGNLDKKQGVGKAAHDTETYLRDVNTAALKDAKK